MYALKNSSSLITELTMVTVEAVLVCPGEAHPRKIYHLIRNRFFTQMAFVIWFLNTLVRAAYLL